MSSAIDAILGKAATDKSPGDGQSGEAALLAEAAEPEAYRPYRIWPRPQLMVSLIEADGTAHGFQYHALRHPKYQVRNGEEFLSFTADGLAVVMQGTGLRILYLALLRYTLAEAREYDGKPTTAELPARITRLEVIDVQERLGQPPRLVNKAS